MIKVIETAYKGYKFRSRLEARWAVFLDSMDFKWVYEPEGYVLNGTPYLPDFYLPELEIWAEVKPEKFSDAELKLAIDLASETNKSVILLTDIPNFRSYEVVTPTGDKSTYIDDLYLMHYKGHRNRLFWSTGTSNCEDEVHKTSLMGDSDYFRAVEAARSARFEFEDGLTGW
jgi:hypothetical protein